MRKELEELKELEENWDGYGACPISEKAIENVNRILELLKQIPVIGPTPNGTVQLEWGDDLEMEIGDDKISGLFTVPFHSEYIEINLKKVRND